MKKQIILAMLFVLAIIGIVSAVRLTIYDDFSDGFLNKEKWEIRQDVEGQPLMDEYDVRNEDGNFVFHTEQNGYSEGRTYLFPKRTFTTGDSLEYNGNLISEAGYHGNMVILTGDHYIRIGIRGYGTNINELGTVHTRLVFEPNNLKVIRKTPSGEKFIDNLYLPTRDGTYEFYIGTYSSDHTHMDYDNFWIN